jgi:hypothetical protein
MKNIHDLAKALAPKFNISVREAYYYAGFIMDTVYKKVASQEYNSVTVPSIGNIYICRTKIRKRIEELQKRIDKLNSEEHYRNLMDHHKETRHEQFAKNIKILQDRLDILTDYRDKQQEYYDFKIKRHIARCILDGKTIVSETNGYASLKSKPLQRTVQPNSFPPKDPFVSMDIPPPEYL